MITEFYKDLIITENCSLLDSSGKKLYQYSPLLFIISQLFSCHIGTCNIWFEVGTS
jgi:hypothetical protein